MHTVTWFQELQSNKNNLHTVILCHAFLSNINNFQTSILSIDRTLTGTTSPVRVDLGIMATKGYSTLIRAPEQVPHHQTQFNIMFRTHYQCFKRQYIKVVQNLGKHHLRLMYLKDGIQISTSRLGQSGPKSNGNKRVTTLPCKSQFDSIIKVRF